jgi:acetylornithine deacetylase/succinyl-diaminopimelate desuccinylase-like protein
MRSRGSAASAAAPGKAVRNVRRSIWLERIRKDQIHVAGLVDSLRIHTRQDQQRTDLLAYGGKHFHLIPGKGVGAAMLNVNDADNSVARDDGRAEKGLKLIFRQFGEAAEAGVLIGFLRNGQQAAFARHPAGQTFAHAQPHFAQRIRSRIVGRAQHQLVVINEIDEAGVATHVFHQHAVDGLQCFLQTQLLHHQPADPLKQLQLLPQSFYLCFLFLKPRHHSYCRAKLPEEARVTLTRMMRYLLGCLLVSLLPAQGIDWKKVDMETLDHFSKLIQINSTDPGGSEEPVVTYLKQVFDREGIESKIFMIENFADPAIKRPNIIARLKGSGKKKPLLIVGHSDTVNIDPKKWTHGPFSAHRQDGYIYGRGTVDDKDNLAAALMTMLLLKRQKTPLDRDVIFLSEAGEEGATSVGIAFLVREHFAELDAEFCLAEGGSAVRTGGRLRYYAVQTTEKLPSGVKLVANGPAGHGSRPLRTNAVVHIANAVSKVAAWQPPMRLNDTTRTYFERMANVSTPEEKERYNGLLNPEKTDAVQEYFAVHEPGHNSMIRTSISPNIIKAGYRSNVIPSEAEATLDIRALPDEDLPKFYEQLKAVINDPQVKIVRENRSTRPGAAPSSLKNEAFQAIEATAALHYPGVPTIPTMSTGATDMAFLRSKGMQCYGIGPLIDTEDGPKGYGAHSDQERILEAELYRFTRFHHDLVLKIAGVTR